MPYKNSENRKEYMKKYARENCRHIKELLKQNWQSRPWLKTLASIRSRCLNKAHHYFKKGIKNFLDSVTIKVLWFRDKAYLLKCPSIDRKDNGGHYTIDNCRFIELKYNKKGGRKCLSG